jgi:hypothetical protein
MDRLSSIHRSGARRGAAAIFMCELDCLCGVRNPMAGLIERAYPDRLPDCLSENAELLSPMGTRLPSRIKGMGLLGQPDRHRCLRRLLRNY